MLSLVKPMISICWDMHLLHSLWRNSLPQGRLVTRTMASGSSLPVMTSKKKQNSHCAIPLGVHHIPQTEGEPPFPLFVGSPQLLLAGSCGHSIERGQRCSLQLAHSCLGASGGQPAYIAGAVSPLPTCDTVSRRMWTFLHLVHLQQALWL